jgi:hypothetical protein
VTYTPGGIPDGLLLLKLLFYHFWLPLAQTWHHELIDLLPQFCPVKMLVEGIDDITNCFIRLEPMSSLQTLDLTMSVGRYYQTDGKEIS